MIRISLKQGDVVMKVIVKFFIGGTKNLVKSSFEIFGFSKLSLEEYQISKKFM